MTLRMAFTLVDSITLIVMIELSESAIRLDEFSVKLENEKLITFIENSVKALKALTAFVWNCGRVASNKNAAFNQEIVTKPMLFK